MFAPSWFVAAASTSPKYLRRAPAKPKRRDCGRMCATTDPQATRRRQRCGLLTRRIARGNIPALISKTSAGSCRPTATPVLLSCIARVVFRKLPAGLTPGVSFTMFIKINPHHLPAKCCNESRPYMSSKARFEANHLTCEKPFGKAGHARCWNSCTRGLIILRRRTDRNRQQRCRTRAARRRFGSQKLSVCGLRFRWRASRCNLQPGRLGQTQRVEPASLFDPCAGADRRPPNQSGGGAAALERFS